jgi:hypothetical protein
VLFLKFKLLSLRSSQIFWRQLQRTICLRPFFSSLRKSARVVPLIFVATFRFGSSGNFRLRFHKSRLRGIGSGSFHRSFVLVLNLLSALLHLGQLSGACRFCFLKACVFSHLIKVFEATSGTQADMLLPLDVTNHAQLLERKMREASKA